MVRGLLCRDEVKTIGVGTAQESRRYQSRSVVANPVPLRRRSRGPDAGPAETGAGHGPVPANSLQGYSGRRRRDASVLDADTLQDPIVAAGRTWKLIPLTIEVDHVRLQAAKRSLARRHDRLAREAPFVRPRFVSHPEADGKAAFSCN